MEFKLAIESGNAAFTTDPDEEVARILRTTAERLGDGEHYGNIHDANGNRVGSYELREDDAITLARGETS